MNREKTGVSFDAARVALFRSRIRAGTFRVDAAAVAARMLRDAPRGLRPRYRPS
jgi:anti-sigma28 factor (negative regulator of flagellin synthesis)